MYTVKDLFDLSRSRAGEYLSGFEFPWEALSGIKNLITEIGRGLDKNEFTEVSPEVWIHKNAVVAPTAENASAPTNCPTITRSASVYAC